MGKIILRICLFFILLLNGCSSSNSFSQYPDEITQAYNYVHSNSQETIKSWKKAKVEEYTAAEDLEILDKEKNKQINIKGIETLKVTFITSDDGNLGPIVVYVDKNTKKILGIGERK